MEIENQDTISTPEELDGNKLGKVEEISNLFNQIPTFNISDLEEKLKGINLNTFRKELEKIIKSIDEDLSIENFFIETQQDIDLIISLSENSKRGVFEFTNIEEFVKYLKSWIEGCSLPKQLLENTKKIPLKVFLEIYEDSLRKVAEDLMFQDRFG